MSASPILITNHLSKFYHDPVEFQALNDVHISIEKGELVAIVGASGSGKSTLLYVLSTLDTDYTGEIIFDGQTLNKLTKNDHADIRNAKMGFVFQFHYLLAEFTVLENVMLPALKLGKLSEEQIRERAINKLDLLGIKEHAEKKASKLSGGQQQRVAIARGLINDPLIIFGDEPTGNLDSKNADLVFNILFQLKQEINQTILIVTHDMNIANRADRIITLHDGKILM